MVFICQIFLIYNKFNIKTKIRENFKKFSLFIIFYILYNSNLNNIPKFTVDYVDSSSSYTVAAGSFQNINISISKTGYKPVGVVNIFFADTNYFALHEFYVNNSDPNDYSVTLIIKNIHTASATSKARAFILYQKL